MTVDEIQNLLGVYFFENPSKSPSRGLLRLEKHGDFDGDSLRVIKSRFPYLPWMIRRSAFGRWLAASECRFIAELANIVEPSLSPRLNDAQLFIVCFMKSKKVWFVYICEWIVVLSRWFPFFRCSLRLTPHIDAFASTLHWPPPPRISRGKLNNRRTILAYGRSVYSCVLRPPSSVRVTLAMIKFVDYCYCWREYLPMDGEHFTPIFTANVNERRRYVNADDDDADECLCIYLRAFWTRNRRHNDSVELCRRRRSMVDAHE